MHVKEFKKVAERNPFRPFTVRLNNGAEYEFTDPKDLGAPKDYHIIFHFGESDSTLIDTKSIVEVIER